MFVCFRTGVAALSIGVFAASMSGASTVSHVVDYQSGNAFGKSLSDVGKVKFASDDPSRSGRFYAGPFALKSAKLGEFWAWCIDIAQNMTNGATYHESEGPGAETLEQIDKLFSTFYAGLDGKVDEAAFQLSLWNIVFDDDLSLSDGNFQALKADNNADIWDRATGFLDAIGNGDSEMGRYRFTFLISDESQDLVTVTAVPLPAAGFFLLAGLAGLGLVRRRA